jgi:hypothetical protein
MKIGKINMEDILLAERTARREISLIDSTGFVAVNKPHKNKKAYNRKSKHKPSYIE